MVLVTHADDKPGFFLERQQFVKLGGSRGDLVAVLDGVRAGQEVVTAGVFKLRTGAAVKVDNSVKPPASSAPKPADS